MEVSGKKILVDCGLFQGLPEDKEKNSAHFPFNPSEIDLLFVTHAHLDHIGRIPKLVKDGFRGKIFSTPATKEIAKFMLEDALKVMEYKKREKGREPLYSEKDIENSFEIWDILDYGESFEIGDGLKVVFRNAGHVLGSAMVEFVSPSGKGSIVFTGDLGRSPNPLLPPASKLNGVRYLVMESVYGDRRHESGEERDERFKEVVLIAIKNSGTLLIPSFSLERTQVILFKLNNLVENNIIPNVPVFLDSPLAIKLTEIYRNSRELFNKEARELIRNGDNIFSFPRLTITKTRADSEEISKQKGPKIIIAGSGMSEGGRIVHHEARYLPNKNNTLLLLGYQAVGTLGRKLQDGAKEVEIDGNKVTVEAKVEYLGGFSGHKDSEELLEFVSEIDGSLEKVFLVMGEPKASLFLAQRIKDYLGVDCSVPKAGESKTLNF